MKNSLRFLSLLLAFASFGQVDRSKLPKPGTPSPIEIGDYKSFELNNGLKVFVIENNKLPRVAFRLELNRGIIDEGDKTGYLDLMGQVMRRGTETRSKSEIDEAVDFIGANLFTSSDFVFGSSLSKYADQTIELMSDVVLNPTFPEDELQKIKKQTLSALKQQRDDPNAIANKLISRVLYEGHPYGKVSTETSVDKITAADLRNYHQTYFRPNVAYLAVVGDISVKQAKKLVEKYFASWEPKEIPEKTFEDPKGLSSNQIDFINRPASVQSVINVTHTIDLKPRTLEAIQAAVMNQILGGGASARLFMNLREDKGYTYGAYATTQPDRWIGAFNASTSVRNEVTDSAVAEILVEMNRICSEKVSPEELELAKNARAGAVIRSLENPQTVASYAINTAMYDLPEDFYSTYLQKIESVTTDDVLRVADKYIQPDQAHITVVGKADDVVEALKRFGPVNYYDVQGNPVDPSALKLPGDLTAMNVLDNYLVAIGGTEKLKAVKTLSIQRSAQMMGQKMSIETKKMAPNKFINELKLGDNVFQTIVFDGEKGQASGMGRTEAIADDAAMDAKVEYSIFPMLTIKEMNLPVRLIGMASVNDQPTILMEVTMPSGNKINYYFDEKSFTLVQTEKNQQTPQGEMTIATQYRDYQTFEGILMATRVEQRLNPQMTMEMKTEKVEINPTLDTEIFIF